VISDLSADWTDVNPNYGNRNWTWGTPTENYRFPSGLTFDRSRGASFDAGKEPNWAFPNNASNFLPAIFKVNSFAR
jgi:hypothetical protein